MAKQKPGVYDRVLECAKEEFLSKGFLDASLRTIAQEAGTSTGSIYTRFGDKEGLFRAIVEPVVDEFRAMFREIQESFHQLDDETQKAEMGRYTAHHQLKLLDYIYDHFDVFRLLLDGAHGTRFACFLDELVDIEVEYTYRYMEVIGCESVNEYFAPIRARREELARDMDYIKDVLHEGNRRANQIAEATLAEVQRAMGMVY